jgi:hypothetical protein
MGKSGGAVLSSSLSIIFIHCSLKTCDRHDATLIATLIFAEKLVRVTDYSYLTQTNQSVQNTQKIIMSKDAKISLDAYPALLAWIDRVKNLSGYVPMDGV